MIIKECAYFIKDPEHINSYGSCNLFPIETKVELRFLQCELIAISKCPYKMYMAKRIDKEELNKQINKILDNKGYINGRHKQKEN